MTQFNLVEEPWIPCSVGDGTEELGLREVLRRAHAIQGLAGLSPPTSVAVHRLLLALVQSIYRPMDDDRWHDLWASGSFNLEVDAYLDTWRHRFELFDGNRPFYQVASLPFEPYERSAVNLTLEWGAGNRELFSHAPADYAFTPAEAARHLLTYQCFSPGGTITFESGKLPDKYSDAAPLNRGAVSVIQGDTLFETLLLNVIDYNRDDGEPPTTTERDAPAWEQETGARPEDRIPLGYLDWMTWQARRVRLHPVNEGGCTVVRAAVAMKGFQLPSGVYPREYETMVAYREVKKPGPGQAPYVPIGFIPTRALWRDSLVLFESVGGQQPQTIRELGVRFSGSADIRRLTLAGIAGERATVTLWRQESLPLPLGYLHDSDLQSLLARAMRVVEGTAGALREATGTLAQWLVAPDHDRPGGRQPDRTAVSEMRDQLATDASYWPQLEAPFVHYLETQARAGYNFEPFRVWAATVRRAAHSSLDAAVNSLDPDARSIRAGVEATARLRRGIARVWKEEVPNEPANAA